MRALAGILNSFQDSDTDGTGLVPKSEYRRILNSYANFFGSEVLESVGGLCFNDGDSVDYTSLMRMHLLGEKGANQDFCCDNPFRGEYQSVGPPSNASRADVSAVSSSYSKNPVDKRCVPSTRVTQDPGGKSSISLSWDDAETTGSSMRRKSAPPGRIRSTNSQCLSRTPPITASELPSSRRNYFRPGQNPNLSEISNDSRSKKSSVMDGIEECSPRKRRTHFQPDNRKPRPAESRVESDIAEDNRSVRSFASQGYSRELGEAKSNADNRSVNLTQRSFASQEYSRELDEAKSNADNRSVNLTQRSFASQGYYRELDEAKSNADNRSVNPSQRSFPSQGSHREVYEAKSNADNRSLNPSQRSFPSQEYSRRTGEAKSNANSITSPRRSVASEGCYGINEEEIFNAENRSVRSVRSPDKHEPQSNADNRSVNLSHCSSEGSPSHSKADKRSVRSFAVEGLRSHLSLRSQKGESLSGRTLGLNPIPYPAGLESHGEIHATPSSSSNKYPDSNQDTVGDTTTSYSHFTHKQCPDRDNLLRILKEHVVDIQSLYMQWNKGILSDKEFRDCLHNLNIPTNEEFDRFINTRNADPTFSRLMTHLYRGASFKPFVPMQRPQKEAHNILHWNENDGSSNSIPGLIQQFLQRQISPSRFARELDRFRVPLSLELEHLMRQHIAGNAPAFKDVFMCCLHPSAVLSDRAFLYVSPRSVSPVARTNVPRPCSSTPKPYGTDLSENRQIAMGMGTIDTPCRFRYSKRATSMGSHDSGDIVQWRDHGDHRIAQKHCR